MLFKIDSAIRITMRISFIFLLFFSLYKNYINNKSIKDVIIYIGIYGLSFLSTFIPFLWVLMIFVVIFLF